MIGGLLLKYYVLLLLLLDPFDEAVADMICDAVTDICNIMTKLHFEKDEAKKVGCRRLITHVQYGLFDTSRKMRLTSRTSGKVASTGQTELSGGKTDLIILVPEAAIRLVTLNF